jgi:hypothetical protein
VSHTGHWQPFGKSRCHLCRIVAYGDNSRRPQHLYQMLKNILANASLGATMLAIGEWLPRIMRMEWENIPEKYVLGDLV